MIVVQMHREGAPARPHLRHHSLGMFDVTCSVNESTLYDMTECKYMHTCIAFTGAPSKSVIEAHLGRRGLPPTFFRKCMDEIS